MVMEVVAAARKNNLADSKETDDVTTQIDFMGRVSLLHDYRLCVVGKEGVGGGRDATAHGIQSCGDREPRQPESVEEARLKMSPWIVQFKCSFRRWRPSG